MKTRLGYVDNLKFLAILTVLMWHLMSLSFGYINNTLNAVCASSSSHAFMFLAGLMAFRAGKYELGGVLTFAKKNAMRLLVPFVVVGGAFGYFAAGTPIAVYGGDIQNYWFLPVLFYLMLVGYFVVWISGLFNRDSLLITGGLFFGVWIVMSIFYLKFGALTPYYLNVCKILPHFAFGVMAARHRIVVEIMEKPSVFFVSVLAFMFFAKFEHMVRMPISPLFGMVCWWQIAKKTEAYLPAAVGYFGRYTMEIYIFHFFLMPNMPSVGRWISADSASALVPGLLSNGNILAVALLTFVVSLCMIVICAGVGMFVHSNRFLAFAVLGVVRK